MSERIDSQLVVVWFQYAEMLELDAVDDFVLLAGRIAVDCSDDFEV